jgi:hypothetical protein
MPGSEGAGRAVSPDSTLAAMMWVPDGPALCPAAAIIPPMPLPYVRVRRWAAVAALLIAVSWPAAASADVVRITIISRTPLFDGQRFGAVGTYEDIRGRFK